MPLPELPHEVVERHGAIAPGAQRQVETEPDRGAPRVIRRVRVLEVRAIEWCRAIDERGELAHLARAAYAPAGAGRHPVEQVANLAREPGVVEQSGAPQDERGIVAGEPFTEPELARDVRAIEVEGLERARPDPLDVPRMEELVRHGVEQPQPVGADRGRGREHGAVAVLHAIAAGPGQVVGDERVRAAGCLERGILPEHLPHLADDPLDIGGEGRDLCRRSVMMDRDVNGRRTVAVGDGERAQVVVADLGRTVHQIGKVRRDERQIVAPGQQLRGHPPRRPRGTLDANRRRPRLEAPCPDERRRHVDMRVRGVHGDVSAIHPIPEEAVLHAHGAIVCGDDPGVRIGTPEWQRLPLRPERAEVEDVLRELVQRVTSGRRAAHTQFERSLRHGGKDHLDVHQPVDPLGEGQSIRDRVGRLGQRAGGAQEERDGHDENTKERHEGDSRSGLRARAPGLRAGPGRTHVGRVLWTRRERAGT